MNIFSKLKEIIFSVLPIMVVVMILNFTLVPMQTETITRFLIGGIFVILGLTFFLFGVDIGIIPIGENSGAALTSKKNLFLLLIVSFLVGFIVTVAEPDVQVLADQVRGIDNSVNKWALILMIAIGVGLFVSIGILRTVLSLPLNIILTVFYVLLFLLAFITPEKFQGVAFDSGGATTGPMTVPFIMALGVGVATVGSKIGKSSSNDDSFGLTGIASIGPILAVIVYGIICSTQTNESVTSLSVAENSVHHLTGINIFLSELPLIAKEVIYALLPLLVMAVVLQVTLLKLPPMQLIRITRGFILCFVGLIFFLLGAKCGFMSTGTELGEIIGKASNNNVWWSVLLVGIGVVFGSIVVCAEPAVWVLTDQVETITGGTIKRKVMLFALSAGVALSIGIAMLRVLLGFSLWYVLIPGYSIALILSYFSPKLFTGIAFDSGGVASGPMTSTFILSFALGASGACGGNPAVDGFGVIALVAMTPLIAIQILGIIFKIKKENKKD